MMAIRHPRPTSGITTATSKMTRLYQSAGSTSPIMPHVRPVALASLDRGSSGAPNGDDATKAWLSFSSSAGLEDRQRDEVSPWPTTGGLYCGNHGHRNRGGQSDQHEREQEDWCVPASERCRHLTDTAATQIKRNVSWKLNASAECRSTEASRWPTVKNTTAGTSPANMRMPR